MRFYDFLSSPGYSIGVSNQEGELALESINPSQEGQVQELYFPCFGIEEGHHELQVNDGHIIKETHSALHGDCDVQTIVHSPVVQDSPLVVLLVCSHHGNIPLSH